MCQNETSFSPLQNHQTRCYKRWHVNCSTRVDSDRRLTDCWSFSLLRNDWINSQARRIIQCSMPLHARVPISRSTPSISFLQRSDSLSRMRSGRWLNLADYSYNMGWFTIVFSRRKRSNSSQWTATARSICTCRWNFPMAWYSAFICFISAW